MKAKLTWGGKEIEVEIAQKELEKLEPQHDYGIWTWVPEIGRYRFLPIGHETLEEAAQEAYELEVARTKIRRSSSFKPDWRDANQNKWYVYYNHSDHKLDVCFHYSRQSIDVTYYETQAQAKQAAKDLEAEYLLVAGVES